MYNELKKEDRILAKRWSDYNFYEGPVYNHPNLTRDEIIRYQKKAFREFYFRPKKILQHLWRAKSPKRLKSFILAGWGLLKKSVLS